MKRIAAIMIASLFVLTAFAVVEMPAAMASTPTQDFSFPYSYGQPQVPSDVGAQGIQGPTVPTADIGNQQHDGTIGKIGSTLINNTNPPMSFFPHISSTLTVQVYNGTYASHVDSVEAIVNVTNITYGTYQQIKTGTTGTATFMVTEGWYYIQASVPSGYINFTESLDIRSVTGSTTIYLLPVSLGSTAVNNGPSTSYGTIYASIGGSVSGYIKGGVEVELANMSSSSHNIIAIATTLQNGTAVFTHVDINFNYGIGANGYNQSTTPIRLYLVNSSAQNENFSFSGKDVITTGLPNGPLPGITSWTGTASGSLPNTNSASTWQPSSTVSFTGGVTYLSVVLNPTSVHNIYINDSIVYVNSSTGSNNYNLYLSNDVVIMLMIPPGSPDLTKFIV